MGQGWTSHPTPNLQSTVDVFSSFVVGWVLIPFLHTLLHPSEVLSTDRCFGQKKKKSCTKRLFLPPHTGTHRDTLIQVCMSHWRQRYGLESPSFCLGKLQHISMFYPLSSSFISSPRRFTLTNIFLFQTVRFNSLIDFRGRALILTPTKAYFYKRTRNKGNNSICITRVAGWSFQTLLTWIWRMERVRQVISEKPG